MMAEAAHIRIAQHFKVHPDTAREWMRRGMIGKKLPKRKRKTGKLGRPCVYVVTDEEIANFVQPRPGPPEKTQRPEAEKLFATGLSERAIAKLLGVSRSTVHKWVKDMPTPAVKRKPETLESLRDESRIAVASAMQATGSTPSEIAETLDVTPQQVYRWRKAGLLD